MSQKEDGKIEKREDGKADFSSFVANGTITQDTSDKIVAFLKDKKASRQADMEKVKSMTDEQKKAYFKDKKGGLFSELVTNGILTQDQAGTMKASIKQNEDNESDDQD